MGVASKTEDVRPTTSRTTTTTSSKTSISGPEQKKDIQIHEIVGTSESPSNKETTTINIQNDRIDNKTEIKIGRGFGKNISIADRTESRKTTTTTTTTVTKSSEKTTIGLRSTDWNGYNPKAASVSLTITPSLYRLIDEAFRNQFLDFEEKVIRIINKLLNDRKISEKEVAFLEADAFEEFTKIFEDPKNT